MSMPDSVLALLAGQDGLVTAAQAREYGMADRTVRRRVHDGGWSRVAPAVFLAGGHPWTDRARVRAAGLWIGERGVVSGPAAAWCWGMLADAPAVVEVTVARRCGSRAHPGTVVRRRDLLPVDRGGMDGIRLTARPLTALETAAALPDGSAFLDRALQRHVRFGALHAAHCRHLGAHGAARAATLVVAAADRADSAAERLLMTILRAAGVTGWRQGVEFGSWTIDVAFAGSRVAVEVDGWAWHVDVARFRSDRHKGNALVQAGWIVLRFAWHDLTNRPHQVLAEIRATVRRAA